MTECKQMGKTVLEVFTIFSHPEVDPICLSLQKEELLDLKRQRADTETRERACNICLTSETKGL